MTEIQDEMAQHMAAMRSAAPTIIAKLDTHNGAGRWAYTVRPEDIGATFTRNDGLGFYLYGTLYLKKLKASPSIPRDAFGRNLILKDCLPYDQRESVPDPSYNLSRLGDGASLGADLVRRTVAPLEVLWPYVTAYLAGRLAALQSRDKAVSDMLAAGYSRHGSETNESITVYKKGQGFFHVQPGGGVDFQYPLRGVPADKAVRIAAILANA